MTAPVGSATVPEILPPVAACRGGETRRMSVNASRALWCPRPNLPIHSMFVGLYIRYLCSHVDNTPQNLFRITETEVYCELARGHALHYGPSANCCCANCHQIVNSCNCSIRSRESRVITETNRTP